MGMGSEASAALHPNQIWVPPGVHDRGLAASCLFLLYRFAHAITQLIVQDGECSGHSGSLQNMGKVGQKWVVSDFECLFSSVIISKGSKGTFLTRFVELWKLHMCKSSALHDGILALLISFATPTPSFVMKICKIYYTNTEKNPVRRSSVFDSISRELCVVCTANERSHFEPGWSDSRYSWSVKSESPILTLAHHRPSDHKFEL